MLLIPVNQFDTIRHVTQQWLNTITYAAMVLWRPESNVGTVTYRLSTTNSDDIYNIVYLAQKLWNLTAIDRENSTGYDYNSLLKTCYNKTICENVYDTQKRCNSNVLTTLDDVLGQNLNLLHDERRKGSPNLYYMPDIPLNFIIAAANLYAIILGNNDGNIDTNYFSRQQSKHLPKITQCRLSTIHNSVKTMPLTLTDLRIMKAYRVEISYDCDVFNSLDTHKMFADYIYYHLAKELPIVAYIIEGYDNIKPYERLTDDQINKQLVDPMGLIKLTSYGLISSTLTRLVGYKDPYYGRAVAAYDKIDKHFTNISARKTFYNNLLELINYQNIIANRISYDYNNATNKHFTKLFENMTIYENYNSDETNKFNQTYATRLTDNRFATWTNVRHLAKILTPEFLEQLFHMPYNMWKSLIDSDYNQLDETLAKLELALYNLIAISLHIYPAPIMSVWKIDKRLVKLKVSESNPYYNHDIFDKVSTIIINHSNITTELKLKIAEYYNLFTADNVECEQNRLKLITQIDQVLEWLEQVLIDYHRAKVGEKGNIICNRIEVS